ncbi:MAG: alpha-glucuronidase, partial [Duncaniella sp.]|nr:alpha-glucuronidase [Duncaniella sp.]
PGLYTDVRERLMTQMRDACWWRDACLLYFSQYSGRPIPLAIPRPVHTLDDMRTIDLGITNFESPTPQLLNKAR